MLEWLCQAEIQADIGKCEFHIQKTKFFCLIISIKGIEIDSHIIGTILDWAQLTSLYYVRSFLGFCNFYRHLIWDFSKLAKSLTSLTKKDTSFDWSSTW